MNFQHQIGEQPNVFVGLQNRNRRIPAKHQRPVKCSRLTFKANFIEKEIIIVKYKFKTKSLKYLVLKTKMCRLLVCMHLKIKPKKNSRLL